MSLNESTITMKLGDYKHLERQIEALETENAGLKKSLTNAQLDSGDGKLTREYQGAFLAAMPVVRFAVGNMDPMSFRGWPYQSLESVAKALRALPGVDEDQKETAGDLLLFVRSCKEWEDAREQGTEQIKLAEQNAARGPALPM